MTPIQKKLTVALWALALLASATLIAAKMSRNREQGTPIVDPPPIAASNQLPVLAEVPAFSLIDQNDKPVTNQTFHGRPWVADFVFTTCGMACPMMSAKMAKLQSAIPDKDVQLVSITVNPEFDSPAVLKEYAKRFSADESRWHFLTGKPDDIYALARGMLLIVVPAAATQPILHNEKFVLIDGAGKMRAVYDSKDDEQLKQLKTDAAALAAEARAGGPHD